MHLRLHSVPLVLLIVLLLGSCLCAVVVADDNVRIARPPPPAVGRHHYKPPIQSLTLRPSPASNAKITISITNKNAYDITTYWIDFKGKLVEYQAVWMGQSANQETYVGHVWLAKDVFGDVISMFTADVDGNTWVLH